LLASPAVLAVSYAAVRPAYILTTVVISLDFSAVDAFLTTFEFSSATGDSNVPGVPAVAGFLLLLASLLLLAYLPAKVSAVAAALLGCSFKNSNFLDYPTTTIVPVFFCYQTIGR
jgi:hypothetical protein